MADAKNLEQKEKIWTLNTESDDVDLIDTNDLLDENDLKKPDPASLKATGIETKRKACANCTCGLAEELDAEAKKEQAHKSACGNVSEQIDGDLLMLNRFRVEIFDWSMLPS